MVRVKGPLVRPPRPWWAGIVSSLVRPSSVRTRIQVVSVVRATSRYGATMFCAAAEDAGTGGETLGAIPLGAAAGRSEAPAPGGVLGGRFRGSTVTGGFGRARSPGSHSRGRDWTRCGWT